jgi:hypothetical protein
MSTGVLRHLKGESGSRGIFFPVFLGPTGLFALDKPPPYASPHRILHNSAIRILSPPLCCMNFLKLPIFAGNYEQPRWVGDFARALAIG